jgi:release factor glutamine methyltransferase
MLLRPPGVYRPQDDTSLLIDVMHRREYASGRTVLDVGTGTGAVAIAAARAGASSVTAVDLSLRSAIATWINSRLHRAPVTVHHGDLFAPLGGRRFELVLTNPPYVPSKSGMLPRHRKGRCWDAGPDGRFLLDRICDAAPGVLADDGLLLIVQSELRRGRDAGPAGGRRARRDRRGPQPHPVRPRPARPRTDAPRPRPAASGPARRADPRDRGPPQCLTETVALLSPMTDRY